MAEVNTLSASLQRNPLALARYIVQEYDKEQPRQQERMLEGHASRTEKEFEDVDGNANSQVQEFRWVSLLRNDEYGQFMDS